MRRDISAILLVLLATGCTHHVYNIAGEKTDPAVTRPIHGEISPKSKAWEGRILRRSGIVTGAPGRTVEMTEAKSTPRCGMYLIGSAMTLGLIPVALPGSWRATIVEQHPGHSTETVYCVEMKMRYSLWEGLYFWHDDEAVTARALAWAYVKNRNALAPQPK